MTGDLSPYLTVDDAISDLPRGDTDDVPNHVTTNHRQRTVSELESLDRGDSQFGTQLRWRLFPGEPARTPSGKKDAFIHPHYPRIFTTREYARIQSFPDVFEFDGGLHAQFHQIANAVPPLLARRLAEVIV